MCGILAQYRLDDYYFGVFLLNDVGNAIWIISYGWKHDAMQSWNVIDKMYMDVEKIY